MGTTLVSKWIKAPPAAIYTAFIDPDKLIAWRAPNNMVGKVYAFDPREGGMYRMALTYLKPEESMGGKSTDNSDAFTGRFVQLIPNEKIVEAIEFQSPDAQFSGEMTITTTLKPVNGGTEVSMSFENMPSGIDPADNQKGSEESLIKLAKLVER